MQWASFFVDLENSVLRIHKFMDNGFTNTNCCQLSSFSEHLMSSKNWKGGRGRQETETKQRFSCTNYIKVHATELVLKKNEDVSNTCITKYMHVLSNLMNSGK